MKKGHGSPTHLAPCEEELFGAVVPPGDGLAANAGSPSGAPFHLHSPCVRKWRARRQRGDGIPFHTEGKKGKYAVG